jgi:hypothetical protein
VMDFCELSRSYMPRCRARASSAASLSCIFTRTPVGGLRDFRDSGPRVVVDLRGWDGLHPVAIPAAAGSTPQRGVHFGHPSFFRALRPGARGDTEDLPLHREPTGFDSDGQHGFSIAREVAFIDHR